MTTSAKATPLNQGHALALAWLTDLEQRLAKENARTGIFNPVPSDLAAFFNRLSASERFDFLDAVGAYIVTTLVAGNPVPQLWDPAEDIAWHKTPSTDRIEESNHGQA